MKIMESLDAGIVKEKTFFIKRKFTYDRIIKYLDLAFTKLPNQKDSFGHYVGEENAMALTNPSYKPKTIELYNVDEKKIRRIESLIRLHAE